MLSHNSSSCNFMKECQIITSELMEVLCNQLPGNAILFSQRAFIKELRWTLLVNLSFILKIIPQVPFPYCLSEIYHSLLRLIIHPTFLPPHHTNPIIGLSHKYSAYCKLSFFFLFSTSPIISSQIRSSQSSSNLLIDLHNSILSST